MFLNHIQSPNHTPRYHYYSEDISDPEGPVTHHSEDLQILIDEVSLAREQLSKSEQFRTECAKLQHTGKGYS